MDLFGSIPGRSIRKKKRFARAMGVFKMEFDAATKDAAQRLGRHWTDVRNGSAKRSVVVATFRLRTFRKT